MYDKKVVEILGRALEIICSVIAMVIGGTAIIIGFKEGDMITAAIGALGLIAVGIFFFCRWQKRQKCKDNKRIS